MKWNLFIYIFILLTILSACTRTVYVTQPLTEEKSDRSASIVLVVRVPTQGNKIRYYKKLLTDKPTAKVDPVYIKSQLEKTIRQDSVYLDILKTGFKTHFFAAPVYYVPDTAYKAFLAGARNVFLGSTNMVETEIKMASPHFFVLMQNQNADQLILTDKDGYRLPEPLPYKKNTFLPAFKKLINKRAYIHNQIKWFNEKLSGKMILVN